MKLSEPFRENQRREINRPPTRILLEEFFRHLVEVKHRAMITARCYAGDVAAFGLYLKWRSILDVDDRDILTYIFKLKGRNSDPTIIRKFYSLRAFYVWAKTTGRISRIPITRDSFLTIKKEFGHRRSLHKHQYELSKPEIDKLFNAISRSNSGIEMRDRLIYWLILFAGVRGSEIPHILIRDLDLRNKLLTIRRRDTRANKRNEIKVDISEMIHVFMAYEKIVSCLGKEMFLFPNKYGLKMSTRSIRRNLANSAKDVGLRINPQILFHNFVLNKLREGMLARELQQYLGHISIQSTRRYVADFRSKNRELVENE